MTLEHQRGVVRRVGERYLACQRRMADPRTQVVVFGKRLAVRAEHESTSCSVAGSGPSSGSIAPESCVSAAAPCPSRPISFRGSPGSACRSSRRTGRPRGAGSPPSTRPPPFASGPSVGPRRGSASAPCPTTRWWSRGTDVCPGYYKDPIGTAELIDADGVDAHRRPGRHRPLRLPDDHGPQEGPDHPVVGQEHLARGDRDTAALRTAHLASGRHRRRPALPHRARHSTPRPSRPGPSARAGCWKPRPCTRTRSSSRK